MLASICWDNFDASIISCKSEIKFDDIICFFLQMVEQYFDKAGKLTNIKPDRLNFYKKADNVVKCSIPIIRDNGVIETISAFRCQHKTHKLPTKGGTRYAENVDF